MIQHIDLGATPFARLRALSKLVKRNPMLIGGHRPGKIYGRLICRMGKRMNVENRVFFLAVTEAICQGYRPCAVCMRMDYEVWKQNRQTT